MLDPLLLAITNHDSDRAIALIDAGADVNLLTPLGDTLLTRAMLSRLPTVAMHLLDAGANANVRNQLFHAIDKRLTAVAMQLIQSGGDVNVKSDFERANENTVWNSCILIHKYNANI